MDLVSGEGRWASFAKTTACLHLAKILSFPLQFTIQRVSEKPLRSKVGVDVLAVAAGRGRSEPVCRVRRIVWGRRAVSRHLGRLERPSLRRPAYPKRPASQIHAQGFSLST